MTSDCCVKIHRDPCLAAGTKQVLILILILLGCAHAAGQTVARTLPVGMFSDIHFDPFHDPAKFVQLQSVPVSSWASILQAPASLHQARDFASLQAACNARDVDTDWALFASSLQAAQREQPTPLFVTVSGDLLVHQYDCRFHTLAPGATPADDMAFAVKTIAFVALQMRLAFPRSPVYLAMGNNDSGCGDFRETPDSKFLHDVARIFADDADPSNRTAILQEFPHEGDYDIALPKSMGRTRLIVLQNIFQSYRYETCNGVSDRTAAQTQVAWLAHHLAAARAHGDNVWVMGHIPTGVNVYATFAKGYKSCSAKPLDTFLSSEALTDTLVDYADVVRLVIFGHTHNDEIRLLESPRDRQTGNIRQAIPVKLVPAISPVHGNNSAFLVATVNPASGTLMDYDVFAASNQTGIATVWSREYNYSEAYGLPDFSAASVARLTANFAADKRGTGAWSANYQQWYSVGQGESRGAFLRQIWPAYVCGLTEDHAADFRRCVCADDTTQPGSAER
jgi:sphingomyelin phosphodiesterase acid-like 3